MERTITLNEDFHMLSARFCATYRLILGGKQAELIRYFVMRDLISRMFQDGRSGK